ncbi:MAG: isoleucine--tRNA ligase [Bacilli bacterium]|jgi:isoleucyl-tRNA synthetase|nr:isoleucine--tRNA ligase [Bacilli bacterium]MDD3388816.1 isoleucine--tRNA ligase [Bacilli bacterium]MDD4344606.1 isoleucine--tRNA ligase [Bacilli bacterium]MDD4520500.1 isoleucine--tRNA ligase [Bacilli bacterium]MDY0399085.1 isoleucine--tRNA ligase [Bacilli bacterium]
MELKNTLLMPKTAFEMRGNLNKKEPLLVQEWREKDLYHVMNKKKENAPTFMLHDGPPYANGNIHCGHMLNRILKDFIVRYKNMAGFVTPFTFGWDTHGLPIENKVTASGVDRKATPINEFRDICARYAKTQVDLQKEQIRRLGCLGDYDQPYLTLDATYEADQLRVFAQMALAGLIYKGKKPVYWSPSSESALAEAEIEYHDVTSPAIYVAFKLVAGQTLLPSDSKLVIWTTTPWTIPANLAISLHPEFTYGLYQTDFGHLVLLTDLAEKVMQDLNINNYHLVRTFKGETLEGLEAIHPLYGRVSKVICGTHVTADAGTGLVHTAPGHGADDFIVGQKYGLEVFCPVDEHGKMTSEAGERLAGLSYYAANKEVLAWLKENDALLSESTIVHSYPHDWRTHKPVIFRATPQWFCSIDAIKEQLMTNIQKVAWTPEWGEKRMLNMVKDRTDWCISRQRVWGVPIPIIYCEDGTPIIEEAVFDYIIDQVKKYGTNVWFTADVKDLLPPEYQNVHSPHGIFSKEKDIMDVWFDSGSSNIHVIKNKNLPYPVDLYLEGNDQYRGWFNSSLIIATALTGNAPYKAVLSHGFVMDENWDKMSKSKGNGIDPIKIADTFGSDILRLWAASVDYQADVRISEDIIKQSSETYRKIRNTLKFLLGNLSSSQAEIDQGSVLKNVQYSFIDQLILNKLYEVTNATLNAYEHYAFANVLALLTNFIVTDLSALYLDYAKDILYCEALNSPRRRAVVASLYTIFNHLIRLLNPLLPFTVEEAYRALNLKEALISAQLLSLPEISPTSEGLSAHYIKFLSLRERVFKQLENARSAGQIGSSQEAMVTVGVDDEKLYTELSVLDDDERARLFIVSKVTLTRGREVEVTLATGTKCERCWNYRDDVHVSHDGHHLCGRCANVIGAIHEEV